MADTVKKVPATKTAKPVVKRAAPSAAVKAASAEPVAAKTAVAKPAEVVVKKTVAKAKIVKNATSVSVPVLDIKGKQLKSIELVSELFGVVPNVKLLAQYVHVYLTNQRQGTASTKTRGEVTMSTRKIYRQKGTGRARHGAASANLFVGGGVTFGPRPHAYSAKLNKKQRKQALIAALSAAAADSKICALDATSFTLKSPSTSTLAAFIKTQKVDKNIVIVMPKVQKDNLVLSLRNIPSVVITDAASLNAYELLRAKRVLFIESALDVLKNHVLKVAA